MGDSYTPGFLKSCGNCKYIERSWVHVNGLKCVWDDELIVDRDYFCEMWVRRGKDEE